MIFNIAVAGTVSVSFPQSLLVDWLRVFNQ